ncbi:hypothetical protein [Bacillus sp. S14(2024)]|uniref:hypothetical protein n=1 Tax=Bacillus sp. S14(2024) TaxID=3162884 RepID=UPI003D1E199F
MRKLICLLVAITYLLSLSGCNKAYKYTGESKNWKGSVIVSQSENSKRMEGSILYKGKDGEKLKNIQWTVTDDFDKQNGNGSLNEGKINISYYCTGCATHEKDEPFHVTVEGDGNKETFEMTYQ